MFSRYRPSFVRDIAIRVMRGSDGYSAPVWLTATSYDAVWMKPVMSLLIGFCFLPESVLSAFFQASQSDPLVPYLALCLSPRYSAWLTIELRRAVGVVGVAALVAYSLLHGGSSC